MVYFCSALLFLLPNQRSRIPFFGSLFLALDSYRNLAYQCSGVAWTALLLMARDFTTYPYIAGGGFFFTPSLSTGQVGTCVEQVGTTGTTLRSRQAPLLMLRDHERRIAGAVSTACGTVCVVCGGIKVGICSHSMGKGERNFRSDRRSHIPTMVCFYHYREGSGVGIELVIGLDWTGLDV